MSSPDTGPANPPVLSVGELPDWLAATPFELDEAGSPTIPLVFVKLGGVTQTDARVAAAERSLRNARRLVVGIADTSPAPWSGRLVKLLTCTLTTRPSRAAQTFVQVADLDATCAAVTANVQRAPRAALAMNDLLRIVPCLPIMEGLTAESLAYSMLLAGPEFARWRDEVPWTPSYQASGEAVLVRHEDDGLHITLNRPERHNAFSRDVRDGLVLALDAALADGEVRVHLSGNGPSFCSGGDLQEWGLAPDPVTAHLVRMERSVAARLHQCGRRLHVFLHGACIGAGMEIAAFASSVVADPNTRFTLPELTMGLVTGAGGSVGVAARIGRWRTAYLLLSASSIDADTALAWGLVDQIADRARSDRRRP